MQKLCRKLEIFDFLFSITSFPPLFFLSTIYIVRFIYFLYQKKDLAKNRNSSNEERRRKPHSLVSSSLQFVFTEFITECNWCSVKCSVNGFHVLPTITVGLLAITLNCIDHWMVHPHWKELTFQLSLIGIKFHI